MICLMLSQGRGVVRDRLPEIVDPVGLARLQDVVVDGADLGARLLVFDQSECGHAGMVSDDGNFLSATVSNHFYDALPT
jgi:hypothetical protein